MGRSWVGNTFSNSKDQQGVHCGWLSFSEGESGRKGGLWGSQGPRLCGFGFHSNCNGNPLGGSEPRSDIILYCTENCSVNYFLLCSLGVVWESVILKKLDISGQYFWYIKPCTGSWKSWNVFPDLHIPFWGALGRPVFLAYQCLFILMYLRKYEEWRGKRAEHLREFLALWNLKYEYGINKLVCRKWLGPFHNKNIISKFSFGIFSEGLMISVGKIRGQHDCVKQNNPSALFYP